MQISIIAVILIYFCHNGTPLKQGDNQIIDTLRHSDCGHSTSAGATPYKRAKTLYILVTRRNATVNIVVPASYLNHGHSMWHR